MPWMLEWKHQVREQQQQRWKHHFFSLFLFNCSFHLLQAMKTVIACHNACSIILSYLPVHLKITQLFKFHNSSAYLQEQSVILGSVFPTNIQAVIGINHGPHYSKITQIENIFELFEEYKKDSVNPTTRGRLTIKKKKQHTYSDVSSNKWPRNIMKK